MGREVGAGVQEGGDTRIPMADFMLMFDRKQQATPIKQLSFNLKINKFIKKRKTAFLCRGMGRVQIQNGYELRSHMLWGNQACALQPLRAHVLPGKGQARWSPGPVQLKQQW